MLLDLFLIASIAAPDLRLEVHRESLSGTHYRYRQYIDGTPVIGGEVNVTVRPDGSREEERTLAGLPAKRTAPADVWVNSGGIALPAVRDVSGDRIRYRSIESGAVLSEEHLRLRAKSAAVFDPNPVAKLNAPQLRDLDDSPAAVPDAAYSIVELNANDTGPLGGPWVQIADLQAPAIAPVDAASPLVFDRGQDGFEDVNAYFHIDRSQRHLRSLGYFGARAVVPYAIETDTHAAGGGDNSFFVAHPTMEGKGRLFFGEGGTDDAEDSDLVVHEYAHAIHEWISPGTFLGPSGSEGRAIGEGFGDYWALSAEYAATLASGRDPFCFADWDARCEGSSNCSYPPGADCLRRLDSAKTMADYVRDNTPGVEHRNGEIWSAALTEIFLELTRRYGLVAGRRISDTLVVESLFGTPPNPSFAATARQMIAADRFVSGGLHASVICSAMMRRGILSDCSPMPRGEVTYFPGEGGGVVVPDNDPAGITLSSFVSDTRLVEQLMVSVNIRHSGRGELHVSLIAPDGTTVRLADISGERAPDLITTFGRDSIPVQSLDVFRGQSAAGEWQLRVADLAFGDVATVVSWSLVIRFQGSMPEATRPVAMERRVIPVVGHAPGANETFFTTDLQVLNNGAGETDATLIFTPSGADGRSDFAAVRVVLGGGESVVFRDVVRTLFVTGGLGQLEVAGDVLSSTRTFTTAHGGTFGLYADAVDLKEAIGRGEEPSHIVHLRNDRSFRSNVGFAEVTGAPARAIVSVSGRTFTYDVPPFGHIQVPLDATGDVLPVRVDVEGDGRLLPYGAVVDNRSGDPILIPAWRSKSGTMVPAISDAGALGTFWRTDLAISAPAELTYTTASASVKRTLNEQARFEDAVATLFGQSGTIGTITRSVGLASTRIWTDGPSGTYGLYAPFGTPSVVAEQHILHVETSDEFRTNIGLLSDVVSRVRVSVLSGDGDVLGSSKHVLQPLQLVQFPVDPPLTNGRVVIEVPDGRVYAYGALVDNRTGDPIFIPARAAP